MILDLGVTWVPDGVEAIIQGSIAGVLTDPAPGLGLSVAPVGDATSIYIAGACRGALFFSYLTNRFGRRKLFLITLWSTCSSALQRPSHGTFLA